jgi:hypothetical protein
LGNSPLTLTATASSGLAVTFSLIAGPAQLSGNTLTLSGFGTVTVEAAQAGNADFSAAPVVDRSFNVLTGFAVWQAAEFSTADLGNPVKSGPTAVYGHDGLPNLVKYALGLDPKVDATGSALPVAGMTATDWVYTYTRPAAVTDVTCTVQVSTDLVNWTSTGVPQTLVSSVNGTDTWQGSYPRASAATVFFRLRVDQP